MKELNSIISELPINKIADVYLIGSENDIYKAFFISSSDKAVKIDLKSKIKGNFRTVLKNNIYLGNLTQKMKPLEAIEKLRKCSYSNGVMIPNKDTLDLTIRLIEILDFRMVKKQQRKTFYSWLISQKGRDDLIGDIANDVERDREAKSWFNYNELKKHIEFSSSNHWEINSFKDCTKEGHVNPILCLRLSKMEFDIERYKNDLKKFAIRDNSGFVYFLKPENAETPIKIGRAKSIERRIYQLQTSLPYDLEIVGFIETDDYISLEEEVHEKLKEYRLRREWFNIDENIAKSIINEYDK